MRCKSCDAVMEPEEIIWRPDRGEHEELCRSCLVQADIYREVEEEGTKPLDIEKEAIHQLLRSGF